MCPGCWVLRVLTPGAQRRLSLGWVFELRAKGSGSPSGQVWVGRGDEQPWWRNSKKCKQRLAERRQEEQERRSLRAGKSDAGRIVCVFSF